MGTFVSNLQVRVGAEGAAAARERLRTAILGYAASHELHACPKEEADRSFAILTSERWLTLLDDALDAQDVKAFEQLGTALGLPCIAVLVHDGDTLMTRGFGGKRERWKKVEPGEEALDAAVLEHGWDREHAWLSFRYLDDAPAAEVLHFREKNPPAWRRKAAGPPMFEKPRFSNTSGLRFAVGERVDGDMTFTLRPSGGAGKGVVVGLVGTALESIRFDYAEIGTARAAFDEVPGGKSRLLVARFPELAIPAGLVWSNDIKPADGLKFMEAQHATDLLLQISGTAEREHRGWLGLIVRATENSGQHASDTTEVFIDTPRRPLTAKNDHYTDALDAPFTLVGHAVLASFDAEAITAAAKRWNEIVLPNPAEGAWLADVRGARSSKQFVVSPATLTTGTAWDAGIAGKGEFHLGLFERDEDEPLREAVGHHTDRGIAGIEIVHVPPQLLLRRSVRYLEDEDAAALEAALVEIIESLPGVEQAYVARWATSGVHLTPYELACGVQQPPTDGTRTLRGVSERMWLGPALLKRIDVKALEQVATLTKSGSSTRVEKLADATLDDLERALMPILPNG